MKITKQLSVSGTWLSTRELSKLTGICPRSLARYLLSYDDVESCTEHKTKFWRKYMEIKQCNTCKWLHTREAETGLCTEIHNNRNAQGIPQRMVCLYTAGCEHYEAAKPTRNRK